MMNSNGMDFADMIFGYRLGKTEIRIKRDEKAKIYTYGDCAGHLARKLYEIQD